MAGASSSPTCDATSPAPFFGLDEPLKLLLLFDERNGLAESDGWIISALVSSTEKLKLNEGQTTLLKQIYLYYIYPPKNF